MKMAGTMRASNKKKIKQEATGKAGNMKAGNKVSLAGCNDSSNDSTCNDSSSNVPIALPETV